MKPKLFIYVCFIVESQLVLAQSSVKNTNEYLNQVPPGLVPKVFAPGLVSLNDQLEFGSVFSKDGKEFFYAIDVHGKAETRVMKLVNQKWTSSEQILVGEKYSYNDPFLSPDETKLYFISDRAMDGTGEKKDYDIWYIQRTGLKWSAPINAGKAINTEKNEYYVSFSQKGDLYFSSNRGTKEKGYDIYRSTLSQGIFQQAIALKETVNTQYYEADVFVAWDESYLIFCADRPEGYGKGDLYISFKGENGTWTQAKNLGKAINTSGHELCPFVTRDGKYLFYSSNNDIYWVSMDVLKKQN